jgi:hypothetical protein
MHKQDFSRSTIPNAISAYDSLPQANSPERAIDTKAMADIIGARPSTLGRMARKGLVPSHFVGDGLSSRRYFPSRVLAALDQLSAGRIAVNKRRSRKTTGQDEV